MAKSQAMYISLGKDSLGQIKSFVTSINDTGARSLEAVMPSFEIIEEEANGHSIHRAGIYEDPVADDPHRFPLGLSPFQIKYLKDQSKAMSLLAKKLKNQDFSCKFDLEAGKVDIRAPVGRKEEEALEIIQGSVVELDFPAELMIMMDDKTEYLPALSPAGLEAMVVKTGNQVKLVGMELQDLGVSLRKSMDNLDIRALPPADTPEQRKEKVFKLGRDECNYLYTYRWAEVKKQLQEYPDVKLEHQGFNVKVISPESVSDRAFRIVEAEVDRIKVLRIQLGAKMNVNTICEVTTELGKKHGCIIYLEMGGGPMPSHGDIQSPNASLSLSIAYLKEARVRVVMNAIEKQKAHVIVNTTNAMLDLKQGKGVSFCILQEAGPSIQTELSKNHAKGIKNGEIAESGPGNIKTCKTIYHGSLPEFPQDSASPNSEQQKDNCFKWLVSMVFNSLIRASTAEAGYGTIAFPALGTGTLQYPAQHVVQLMYRAIKLYNEDKRARNIKDIIIVIYPDTKLEVKQMFLAHRQTYKLNTLHVGSVKQIHEENKKEESRKCEFRITVDEILLQVVNCDLRQAAEASEAIILLWSKEELEDPSKKICLTSLDPHRKSWACCSSYVSELDETMCTVDTTTLRQRTLVHVMCSDTQERSILAALATGLKEASKANCNTVTIPVTNTGVLGKKPRKSAKLIVKVVQNGAPGVHVVTLAIQEDATFVQMATYMETDGKQKFHQTAETDKSTVAVDLWEHTYAQIASQHQGSLEQMMTLTNAQFTLTITSDSDSKNNMAKDELCERLGVKLGGGLQQQNL